MHRPSWPITLIQGSENQVWTLEATETTFDALVDHFGNADGRYARHVIEGYGHLDTVFGKNAVHDTYPTMLDHLVRAGA